MEQMGILMGALTRQENSRAFPESRVSSYYYSFSLCLPLFFFFLVVPGLSCGRQAPWLQLAGS